MIRVVLTLALFLFVPAWANAFWPVYWELDGQKNVLGPLFSYDEEGGETHVTVRPFLSSYDSPDSYSFVFPLGKSTAEKAYFVPLYSRHTASVEKHDVSLFPFFWGRDSDRSYGGVFPFYGKLYHRYRRDEIGFVMWPLYAYSTGDGITRTNVVWPLFSFYSGNEEGFKLGPLYGQRQIGEDRRSMFVMWPFFIKDEKGLTTDQPMKSTWAVPFYLHSESPQSEYYGVLWPFFTYSRVRDRVEVNAPWPFFSYTNGEEEQKKGLTLWPIYSHSKSEKDDVTYVLWPLYKGTEHHPGDAVWTESRILLLNRYISDDRGTFLNVWPFFEYRASDADKDFFFPSVLPWRDKGFDRIIRPLITFYEFRRKDDKIVSNFLYGLYTKEQKGEYWRRRLAFLFEAKKDERGVGFQVLSGLFGIDREAVKLFFVPIKRGQKDVANAPPNPETE
jgi:hypothetical protein